MISKQTIKKYLNARNAEKYDVWSLALQKKKRLPKNMSLTTNIFVHKNMNFDIVFTAIFHAISNDPF